MSVDNSDFNAQIGVIVPETTIKEVIKIKTLKVCLAIFAIIFVAFALIVSYEIYNIYGLLDLLQKSVI